MAKQIEDEVAYYYDSHPTEEDLMGEASDHATLVRYLKLPISPSQTSSNTSRPADSD